MELKHITDTKKQMDNIITANYGYKKRITELNKKIICGCDTETIKGKAFLMNIYNGYEHNTHEIKTFNDFLDNYFTREYMETINFFHNLQFDYQAILKHLSDYNLSFIAKHDITYYLITRTHKIYTTSKYDLPYNERFIKAFQINIIPKRLFKISEIKLKNGKIQFNDKKKIIFYSHKLRFYDMAQFYNYKSLKYLAEKYELEQQKVFVEDIKNINYTKFKNNIKYHSLIEKRIESDCVITQNLAQKLYNNIWQIQPCNKFYSIASISEQILKLYLKKHNIPRFVSQYFLWAYAGGRFECFKKGLFNDVYEIDINSGYPAQINKLIEINNKGFWNEITDKCSNPEAKYGVYYIKINIENNYICPIKLNTQKPLPFPNGNIYLWIDKNELDLLDKYGYEYKIIKGVEYITYDVVYPFKFVEELYKQKSLLKNKDNEMYNLIKIILNAIYGKFIQLKPINKVKKLDFNAVNEDLIEAFNLNGIAMGIYNHTFLSGGCFNPVYGCFIPSALRCQLYNDCKDNVKDLIGLQTDSIITKRKLLNLPISKKMGEYSYKQKQVRGIMVASGINQIGDITKFRGFATNINLFKELNNGKIKDNKLVLDLIRFTKLKESYKQIELNYEMINIPREVKTLLDVNSDKKRVWNDKFNSPHEVLEKTIDSVPLTIVN